MSLAEAVISGFLLFCVHSRSRAGGASREAKEPEPDEVVGMGVLGNRSLWLGL